MDVKTKMANLPNKFMGPGFLGRLIQDFRLLFSLINDYRKGVYRDVSIWSIIVFVLTIIYIISPVDIIPDFMLGLGQIDDAAVLFFCLRFIERDLYKYMEWKNSQAG